MQAKIQQLATTFATQHATLIAQTETGNANAIAQYEELANSVIATLTANAQDSAEDLRSDFDYYVEQAQV